MIDNFDNNDSTVHTPFIPGHSMENHDDGSSSGINDQTDDFNMFGSSVRRKRIQEGTVLIIAFLFIACGILIGMRWFSSKAINVSRDEKVENKVNAFISVYQDSINKGISLNKRPPQADIMVDSLTNDRTDAQVPLEQIKMNPFMQQSQNNVADDQQIAKSPGINSEEIRRREREKKFADLTLAVNKLQLNSIVGGPGRYIAQLGNNIVQLGDTINEGQFTISDITSVSITLTSDDFDFVINLE